MSSLELVLVLIHVGTSLVCSNYSVDMVHNISVASVYVASTWACDISEAENKINVILFHYKNIINNV